MLISTIVVIDWMKNASDKVGISNQHEFRRKVRGHFNKRENAVAAMEMCESVNQEQYWARQTQISDSGYSFACVRIKNYVYSCRLIWVEKWVNSTDSWVILLKSNQPNEINSCQEVGHIWISNLRFCLKLLSGPYDWHCEYDHWSYGGCKRTTFDCPNGI